MTAWRWSKIQFIQFLFFFRVVTLWQDHCVTIIITITNRSRNWQWILFLFKCLACIFCYWQQRTQRNSQWRVTETNNKGPHRSKSLRNITHPLPQIYMIQNIIFWWRKILIELMHSCDEELAAKSIARKQRWWMILIKSKFPTTRAFGIARTDNREKKITHWVSELRI